MMSVNPNPEQVAWLMANRNKPGPIFMLNLLRFHTIAKYKDETTENPEGVRTGRDAYEKYSLLVHPHLMNIGGRVRNQLKGEKTIIGPVGEEWDEMLLVEYPSIKAFLSMITNREYSEKIVIHREAALKDARLIMFTSAQAKI